MIDKENLPKGWAVAKLGEICFTTSGGTPSRNVPKYYNGNIPWVKSGELNKGLILDTEEKITEEAIKDSSAKLFPKGTLLIALYGATVGKLAFLGIEAATNQAVCGIFKSEAINSNFLYYFLLLQKSKLVGQSIGGAQPNISQGIVKDLEIPLAPLNEQKRILAKLEQLLTDLDKGIEYLETSKQQLKVYRQAVLKWAFEGKLTNKEEFEGEFPNGWEKKMISDVAETFGGYAFKSGEFQAQGEYQVLRMGNVRPGVIRFDESPVFVSKIDDKALEKSLLAINDVIITQTGTKGKRDYGFTALVNKKNLLLNQRIAAVRCKKDCLSKFLLYYTWTDKFKNQFFANETGNVGQGNVGMKAVTNTFIGIPNIDEQKLIISEIESRLSVCDKIEETIEKSLQQAEALRLSIIKKAFEGKLVPQDPNDEPAEELLARIRAAKASRGKPEKKNHKKSNLKEQPTK
jgi:type I restriction enzyme S subunit